MASSITKALKLKKKVEKVTKPVVEEEEEEEVKKEMSQISGKINGSSKGGVIKSNNNNNNNNRMKNGEPNSSDTASHKRQSPTEDDVKEGKKKKYMTKSGDENQYSLSFIVYMRYFKGDTSIDVYKSEKRFRTACVEMIRGFADDEDDDDKPERTAEQIASDVLTAQLPLDELINRALLAGDDAFYDEKHGWCNVSIVPGNFTMFGSYSTLGDVDVLDDDDDEPSQNK